MSEAAPENAAPPRRTLRAGAPRCCAGSSRAGLPRHRACRRARRRCRSARRPRAPRRAARSRPHPPRVRRMRSGRRAPGWPHSSSPGAIGRAGDRSARSWLQNVGPRLGQRLFAAPQEGAHLDGVAALRSHLEGETPLTVHGILDDLLLDQLAAFPDGHDALEHGIRRQQLERLAGEVHHEAVAVVDRAAVAARRDDTAGRRPRRRRTRSCARRD